MPVRADGKIALAPPGDIVEFAGVGDGPPLGRLKNGGFSQFQFVLTSNNRALDFSVLRIGGQSK
jgi:hypothetical protein